MFLVEKIMIYPGSRCENYLAQLTGIVGLALTPTYYERPGLLVAMLLISGGLLYNGRKRNRELDRQQDSDLENYINP